MAFIAKLTNIKRADLTLEVKIEYLDEASSWTTKRVLNFPGDTVSLSDIRSKVIELGTTYKNALTNETTLKANIGTQITI